jgi:DNA polymerase-4
MGKALLRTAFVTGLTTIGALAALTDSEADALFGRRGIALRDNARGIDATPVLCANTNRKIEHTLNFEEDVIDMEIIRGALIYLSENAGMEMRSGRLGTCCISLNVTYSDGAVCSCSENFKHLILLDREIWKSAFLLYTKAVQRRVRIRSVTLSLESLLPLSFEPELFIPDTECRERQVQNAADNVRVKYGIDSLVMGSVLAASSRTAQLSLHKKTSLSPAVNHEV